MPGGGGGQTHISRGRVGRHGVAVGVGVGAGVGAGVALTATPMSVGVGGVRVGEGEALGVPAGVGIGVPVGVGVGVGVGVRGREPVSRTVADAWAETNSILVEANAVTETLARPALKRPLSPTTVAAQGVSPSHSNGLVLN